MQETHVQLELDNVPLLAESKFPPLRMVEHPQEREKRQRNAVWARLAWYLSIILFIILPGWYIDHLVSTILAVVFGASFGLFVGYWYTKICYYLEVRRTGRPCMPDMGMILIPWMFSMVGTWLVPWIHFTYIALAYFNNNV